jgi:hypothetical protein
VSSRFKQSRAELEIQLEEQLGFLRSSAAVFDAGVEHEAKRLATSLRILLHDSRQSVSLLGQLDLKGIGFFDTARDLPSGNILTDACLVGMQIAADGSHSWWVPLDKSVRGSGIPVEFDRWWAKVVFRDVNRETITREKLVLSVADQDGGAHVDPALDKLYADLSRGNSMGWKHVHPDGDQPWPGPHFASLRQIAHEVLYSLEKRVPPIAHQRTEHVVNVIGVGRNEPCPCGSGRKYKKCCG